MDDLATVEQLLEDARRRPDDDLIAINWKTDIADLAREAQETCWAFAVAVLRQTASHVAACALFVSERNLPNALPLLKFLEEGYSVLGEEFAAFFYQQCRDTLFQMAEWEEEEEEL